jgi:FdhD protein
MNMAVPALSFTRVKHLAWTPGHRRLAERALPEECAVALVYNGSTAAVMMATPDDLADFAIGFSLTEGIIAAPGDVAELDTMTSADGIELRMWLDAACAGNFQRRQRRLAGPTGCGLCGIESLAEASKAIPPVAGATQLTAEDVEAAIVAMEHSQVLRRATRATHAAGFYAPGRGIVAVREDVGRHNALDKLAGALACDAGTDRTAGAVVITSRVSVEMVQKTAAIGAPFLIAISAPTALAVRAAEACGLTLIAAVRGDSFEIFTHQHRVAGLT